MAQLQFHRLNGRKTTSCHIFFPRRSGEDASCASLADSSSLDGPQRSSLDKCGKSGADVVEQKTFQFREDERDIGRKNILNNQEINKNANVDSL